MGIPIDSFLPIINNCVRAKQEEVRQAYVQSAFVGWQIQEVIKGALSEKAKPQKFDEYLNQFGLGESGNENNRIRSEATAEEAIASAEEILRIDREQRKGGN